MSFFLTRSSGRRLTPQHRFHICVPFLFPSNGLTFRLGQTRKPLVSEKAGDPILSTEAPIATERNPTQSGKAREQIPVPSRGRSFPS